jgi:peptidoglycan/LPS O-acetylase OafA/YrhL
MTIVIYIIGLMIAGVALIISIGFLMNQGSDSKQIDLIVFFASLFSLILASLAYNSGTAMKEREAVRAGVGEYRANNMGETSFHFISSKKEVEKQSN